MKGSFVVYLLKNEKGQRYIGITSDLVKRIQQHNKGFSFFTKRSSKWKVDWLSNTLSYTEALKLEKLLKKQKGGQGLERLLELHKKLGS